MCGKDIIMKTIFALCLGSPPHVRERPAASYVIEAPTGITPACAGKTGPFYKEGPNGGDHPRMCGKD